MRKFIAEVIGTYGLVFAGTGAIVINGVSDGAVTHMGIALVFGLVVLAMIHAVGDISGAHLNPAVTIGFLVAKRFPLKDVLPYLLAQSLGALAASATLAALFVEHRGTLGATLPSGPWWQSFILEVILTFYLMLVILGVSTGAKEKGIIAGVVIGGTVALEALFAGPVCGASMNPARSLGPAVVSGHLEFLWIYLTATVIGAVLGVFAFKLMHRAENDDAVDVNA